MPPAKEMMPGWVASFMRSRISDDRSEVSEVAKRGMGCACWLFGCRLLWWLVLLLLFEELVVVFLEEGEGVLGGGGADGDDGVGACGVGVHVVDLDVVAGEELQWFVEAAGGVGDDEADDVGGLDGDSLFPEHAFGCVVVAGDHAQDAEVGGVGDAEGADVDVVLGEDAGDVGQPAGLVFEEHGELLDHHGVRGLVVAVVDDALCFACAALDAAWFDELDAGADAEGALDVVQDALLQGFEVGDFVAEELVVDFDLDFEGVEVVLAVDDELVVRCGFVHLEQDGFDL
ncbi:hypothetical protein Ptc2401_01333 [Prosthecochloris sp. CIB 2401]|nr:hypothetical protein Ptc2401_01333 [Prosthecochloris sp. CIB 2401]